MRVMRGNGGGLAQVLLFCIVWLRSRLTRDWRLGLPHNPVTSLSAFFAPSCDHRPFPRPSHIL